MIEISNETPAAAPAPANPTPPRSRAKVTTAQVVAFVGSEKRTVGDVAAEFAVTAATARKHLAKALELGVLALATDVRKTGSRGRPSELYFQPTGAPAATSTQA